MAQTGDAQMKRGITAAVLAGAALSMVVTGAAPAAAQGELLSLSDLIDLSNLVTVSPSVLTSCYQLGQGEDNKFRGMQTITCNQSATATATPPPPPPPVPGGLTGGTVHNAAVNVPPGGTATAVVLCPEGTAATGGGHEIGSADLILISSTPNPIFGEPVIGWAAEFANPTNVNQSGFAFVVCYDVAS